MKPRIRVRQGKATYTLLYGEFGRLIVTRRQMANLEGLRERYERMGLDNLKNALYRCIRVA